MPSSLCFTVPGDPVPQGSVSVFNGRICQPAKVKRWRKKVADIVKEQGWFPSGTPLAVKITFDLWRPKTVTRRYPAVKPDLDKLARAILDALTESLIWGDDAQVVDLQVSKRYAAEPLTTITVSEVE